MKLVKPKVFFLGQPEMHMGTQEDPGVIQWLDHIGGAEALKCLSHVTGSDIEQLIELLARRCYKSYAPGLNPNVTKVREDSTEYHANIIKAEHGSVVANGGMVQYAFEDVSRVFTHEIVRNTIGTERSQESLRYVRLTDIKFWVPPIIENEKEAKSLTAPPMAGLFYVKFNPSQIFEHVVKTCEWGQNALAGYYDIDSIKDFTRKKHLTSAFRRIAPIGLATGIGMSFNLRAMRWIIQQRTDTLAEEEIRFVFGLVAEDASKRWPMYFQDMHKIYTDDGLFKYTFDHPKI